MWEHAADHDLVVIATANDSHVPLAARAIEVGLPVVVDKPLAPTSPGARELVERFVRRSKVPVIVGVSAPGFAAMRSLARSSMEAGASAVMIAPPPSLRTDDQIVGYFGNAVEAIGRDGVLGAGHVVRLRGFAEDFRRTLGFVPHSGPPGGKLNCFG